MSAKDCGNHGHCQRRKLCRRLFAAVLTFIIVVLVVILVVWLVLRPSKPKFYLKDTSIFQLNLTAGANLLTTVMQVTLASRNLNDRVGIYYDELDAFAAYKGQRITASTALPTGYQGHDDVVVWSPYLYGAAVAVAPYLAVSLNQDREAGLLLVYIKAEGRLRWKVGTWISGHYHLQANCPAFLAIDNGKGSGSAPSLHLQQISSCSVDV
ncbi:unnamed protein product [Musa textilis]